MMSRNYIIKGKALLTAIIVAAIIEDVFVIADPASLSEGAEAQGLQLRVSAAEKTEFENHFFGPQIVQIIIEDRGATDADESTSGLQVKGTSVPRVHLGDGLWYSFIAEEAAFLLFADLLSDGLTDGNIDVATAGTADTPTGFTVTTGQTGSFIRDITIEGTAIFIEIKQSLLFPSLPIPFVGTGVLNPDLNKFGGDGADTCTAATAPGGFDSNSADAGCDWPYIRLFPLIETDVVDIRTGSASVELVFDDFQGAIMSSVDRTTEYPVNAEVIVQFMDLMWNINPVEEDVVTFVLDKNTGTPNRIIYQPTRNFPDDNTNGVPDNLAIANADFLEIFTAIDFDGRQVLELDAPEGIQSIKYTFAFDADQGEIGTFAKSPSFTATDARALDATNGFDDGTNKIFIKKPDGTFKENLAKKDDGPAVRMVETDPNTNFFESIDEAQGSRANVFTAANDKVASWDYFDLISSTPMKQHDGFTTVDAEIYDSADRAVFTITDPDLNLRSRISETIDAREGKNFIKIGDPIPIINTRIDPEKVFDPDLNKVKRIWEATFMIAGPDPDKEIGGLGGPSGSPGVLVRVDVDGDGKIDDETTGGTETFHVLTDDLEIPANLNTDTNGTSGGLGGNDRAAIFFTSDALSTASLDLIPAIIIDTNLTLDDIDDLVVSEREMTVQEVKDQINVDNVEDGTSDQFENWLVQNAKIVDKNNKVVGRDITLTGASDPLKISIPKYNLIQLDTFAMNFERVPTDFVIQIEAVRNSCNTSTEADAFKVDTSKTDPRTVGADDCVVTRQIVDFTPFPAVNEDNDGDVESGDDYATAAFSKLDGIFVAGDTDLGFNRDPLAGKRTAIGSFRVLDLVDALPAGVKTSDVFIRFELVFIGDTDPKTGDSQEDEPQETMNQAVQILALDILGMNILFDPPSQAAGTGKGADAIIMDRLGTFSNMIYRLEPDEASSDSSIFTASADFMTATQLDTIADVLGFIVPSGDPAKIWMPERIIPPDRLAFSYLDEDIVNFFRSVSATFIYETRDGKITWDKNSYKFGADATITVEDQDLNRRPDARDRYGIPLDGMFFFELGKKRVDTACNPGTDTNCIFNFVDSTLLETGPDTGVFVAQMTIPKALTVVGSGTALGTKQEDFEVNYVDIRDRSSIGQEFDGITNVRTEIGQVVIDREAYAPGAIMYVEINEGDANLNVNTRDIFDLTTQTDFSSSGTPKDLRDVVQIKLFKPGNTTATILTATPDPASPNESAILDRNSKSVTQALETGPHTNIFEFEVLLPADLPANTAIEVIYNDPADESGAPEDVEESASILFHTASFGSDKTEYHLGEPITVWIVEPDRNLDSRTIEHIPFDEFFITTDKADELPLDFLIKVLQILGELGAVDIGFREIDFNAGIFAIIASEGVVDDVVVSRGEEIEITFFDKTPSGGGDEIRVEYEVQMLEVEPEIIFDKEEYTPFDEVIIKIVSPDSNEEPSEKDRIRVLVSSSSDSGLFLEIPEIGFNTGMFEEDFDLTPNKSMFIGDLVAQREDGLSVEFRIDEDTVVTESVFVNYHVGIVTFDRPAYGTGDIAVISVIDPDESKNPDTIDTLDVRIWSTSDRGGLLVTLRETGDRTGVFEEILTFTTDEESTGTRLRVSNGDTITAKYADRTLPAPAALDNDGIFTVEVEELFASSLISATASALERISLSEPIMVDQSGLPIEKAEIGQPILIQAEITNNQNIRQKFAYAVQLKDSKGVTLSLSWLSGELAPNNSVIASQSWIPERVGSYEIQVFVWEGMDNPHVLSPSRPIAVSIS